VNQTSGPPPFLAGRLWAIAPGERAALVGVLALLRPRLAVEIGFGQGGSLERISAFSEAVHAFDLTRPPRVTPERFPNVTFHIGDSHELLPGVLEQLAGEARNIDFAFVDGDHTAEGVRRDLEDLLASPSTARTVIVLHDTLNPRVRAGLEHVDYDSFDKVSLVDLDFVPGGVIREGEKSGELWCGLGVVVTGWELPEDELWPPTYSAVDAYEAFLGGAVRKGTPAAAATLAQLMEVERELRVEKDVVRLMAGSFSWRVTAPLRSARDGMRRLKGRRR
jgi:methyltransferase family protein